MKKMIWTIVFILSGTFLPLATGGKAGGYRPPSQEPPLGIRWEVMTDESLLALVRPTTRRAMAVSQGLAERYPRARNDPLLPSLVRAATTVQVYRDDDPVLGPTPGDEHPEVRHADEAPGPALGDVCERPQLAGIGHRGLLDHHLALSRGDAISVRNPHGAPWPLHMLCFCAHATYGQHI